MYQRSGGSVTRLTEPANAIPWPRGERRPGPLVPMQSGDRWFTVTRTKRATRRRNSAVTDIGAHSAQRRSGTRLGRGFVAQRSRVPSARVPRLTACHVMRTGAGVRSVTRGSGDWRTCPSSPDGHQGVVSLGVCWDRLARCFSVLTPHAVAASRMSPALSSPAAAPADWPTRITTNAVRARAAIASHGQI